MLKCSVLLFKTCREGGESVQQSDVTVTGLWWCGGCIATPGKKYLYKIARGVVDS